MNGWRGTQKPASRNWLWLVLTAVSLLLVGGCQLFPKPTSVPLTQDAEAELVSGKAWAKPANAGGWTEFYGRLSLFFGDQLRVPDEAVAAAEMRLADGTMLRLEPGTVIELTNPVPPESRPMFRVLMGRLAVTAASSDQLFAVYVSVTEAFTLNILNFVADNQQADTMFQLWLDETTARISIETGGPVKVSTEEEEQMLEAEWEAWAELDGEIHVVKPQPPDTPTPTTTTTPTHSPTPTMTYTPSATPTFTATLTPTLTPTATSTPSPPTPIAGPTSAATPIVYILKPGDNLWTVAQKYGVSVEALQEANGITDPSTLQIGQELIIPQTEQAEKAPTGVVTPKPTVKPTVALPQVYQAPTLVEPHDNKVFGFDQQQSITLSWVPRDQLATEHWYEVQLWQEDEDPTGRYWTKENWWEMGLAYYPGDYYWRVVIVQGKEMDVMGAVSPPSETRFFQWIPVAPTPTPGAPPRDTPRPTNTPQPPPTNTPVPEVTPTRGTPPPSGG